MRYSYGIDVQNRIMANRRMHVNGSVVNPDISPTLENYVKIR